MMNNILKHLSTLGEEAKAKGKVAAFFEFVNTTVAQATDNYECDAESAECAVETAIALLDSSVSGAPLLEQVCFDEHNDEMEWDAGRVYTRWLDAWKGSCRRCRNHHPVARKRY